MDKRYQIFVSSTYEDLKEARQQVIETIIDMHHMPAAMEQFPASPEDQFSYIKRIIDDSDYYILILGGKYGSIEPNSGKSYTELEYRYATEKGIPVLAFFHEHPEKLPAEFYETDSAKRAKLEAFRNKVKSELGSPWNEVHELPKKVMQSLNEAIKNFERTGWVRADKAAANEVSTAEQNQLLKEREALKAEIERLNAELDRAYPSVPDIAGLDEDLPSAFLSNMKAPYDTKLKPTWKMLFLEIAINLEMLKSYASPHQIRRIFPFAPYVPDPVKNYILQAIGVQYEALKLIKIDYQRNWELTENGKRLVEEDLITLTAKKQANFTPTLLIQKPQRQEEK